MSRELTVNAERPEKVPLRLSMEWLSGTDNDGMEFQLITGAGLGGAFVTLKVTLGGETVYEEFDMRDVLREWVGQITAEMLAT
jgi:hypothetical protein